MTALSPHTRPIALFTGYICSIQAAAWLAMSILGLIGHGTCDLWEEQFSNRGFSFLFYIQTTYFQNRDCGNLATSLQWSNNIMNPSAILAWMIIMIVVNTAWLLASLSFVGGWDQRSMKFTVVITATWCFSTAVVCVVDTIACAMFGADYGSIYQYTAEPNYLVTSAVLMTLSARGFVLWIFNFSMLVYFTAKMPKIQRHATTLKEAKKSNAVMDLYGPPAPAYDAFNDGFVSDLQHDNHAYNHGTNRTATESLARGYEVPLGHHIPRPDYSPPVDTLPHSHTASSSDSNKKKQNKSALRSALKTTEF